MWSQTEASSGFDIRVTRGVSETTQAGSMRSGRQVEVADQQRSGCFLASGPARTTDRMVRLREGRVRSRSRNAATAARWKSSEGVLRGSPRGGLGGYPDT